MTEGFLQHSSFIKPASPLSHLLHHLQCIFVPFTCSYIFLLLSPSPPFSAHQLFSLFHTYPLLSVGFFNIPDPTPLFFAIFLFASTFFCQLSLCPSRSPSSTFLHVRGTPGTSWTHLMLAGLACGLPWQRASSRTAKEQKKSQHDVPTNRSSPGPVTTAPRGTRAAPLTALRSASQLAGSMSPAVVPG